MNTEVTVPPVGESITSGVVSVWHKKSGEVVKAGDALFTLETDKVSTEITADKDGILRTRVPEGAEVKIGEVVAVIEEGSGAAPKGSVDKTEGKTKVPAKESLPAMSPSVRRVVTEEKLDPAQISGSGKGGRLTKGDVLAAATEGEPVMKQATPSDGAAESRVEARPSAQMETERFTRRKMSPLRRKIAAQLVMAQHTAATLTTFNECDMTAVQALRAKAQDAFTKKYG